MIDPASARRFSVAMVAGSLGQGGAEKQLVYMARSLRSAGVDVRVYCVTRGEHYESALTDAGIPVIWIGRFSHPLVRLASLVLALRRCRPHVVQSTHFFTNLYATGAARIYRAVGIGAIRNDGFHDVETMGRWGRWLMRLPPGLLANSFAAHGNAVHLGAKGERTLVLHNVIDVAAFDAESTNGGRPAVPGPVVATVASLRPAKRLDRFLEAVASARHQVPELRAMIVGDGSERARLVAKASELDLLPSGVDFKGRSDDVPRLLGDADIFLLTSDHEGFPNVLLEAMTAKLPVVTTPAGDAGVVTKDGVTGFVVAFDAVGLLAERLVDLARSSQLRQRMGHAGRQHVVDTFSLEGLADRLFRLYHTYAVQQEKPRVLSHLPRATPRSGRDDVPTA